MTLLDEVREFIAACPNATWDQVRERFGEPVHVGGSVGSYKVYIEAVYLRGGQFVHIQHRSFGNEQAIRVRLVEPMERVIVRVDYVASATGEEDEFGWVGNSGLVPTAEAIMEALAR